jgi:hypothetical protein
MFRCNCVISLTQLGLMLTISLLPIVYFSFSLPTIPRHFESACLTDPDSKVEMSLGEFIGEHKRRHHEEAFKAHWQHYHAWYGKFGPDHKKHNDDKSEEQGTSGNAAHRHWPDWGWWRGRWGAAEDTPDRHDLRGPSRAGRPFPTE